MFLGVGKKSPIAAIEGEMGWTPVYVRQQLELIRYFIRLTKLPEDRLERRIFDWDYNLCALGRKSWCKDVKKRFR